MLVDDLVKYKGSKTGNIFKVVEVRAGSLLISPIDSTIRIGAQIDELRGVGRKQNLSPEATKSKSRGARGRDNG